MGPYELVIIRVESEVSKERLVLSYRPPQPEDTSDSFCNEQSRIMSRTAHCDMSSGKEFDELGSIVATEVVQ